MVQVAILAVLVLIAVLLAPWLLGMIIVLIASYGVWLVVLGALMATLFVVLLFWGAVSSQLRQRLEARKMRAQIDRYDQQRALKRQRDSLKSGGAGEPGARACWFCDSEIDKASQHCRECNRRQRY